MPSKPRTRPSSSAPDPTQWVQLTFAFEQFEPLALLSRHTPATASPEKTERQSAQNFEDLCQKPRLVKGAHELRVRNLFERAIRERKVAIKDVRIEFKPYRSTLYSMKIDTKGVARVHLHSIFREAPEDVLMQAARLMLSRGKRRQAEREAYDAFVRAIPPAAFRMPGARKPTPQARPGPGLHRSLEESFERVNARYFPTPLGKPELCWSPKRAKRILGSYCHRTDRLIVSRIFDSMRVPLYVLDFLMYHELLHKFLGIKERSDGRRSIHSPEFRTWEQKFEAYEQALAYLKKL